MKTEVMMKRELDGHVITQSSKNGYFNANEFLSIANKVRLEAGLPVTSLNSYFSSTHYKEIAQSMKTQENVDEEDLKIVRRGKYGGTHLHPYVFLDFALWASPSFRLKVIKWLYDALIDLRNAGGDAFKEANFALTQNFKNIDKWTYADCATMVKDYIGVDNWEKATEDQLEKRKKLCDAIKYMSHSNGFNRAQDLVRHVIKLDKEGII